jgi:DNA polymerase-3 subunit epsilon
MIDNRIVTGLDLETTGLKWNDAKNPDRVTEICMIPYRLRSRKPMLVFEQRLFSGRMIAPKVVEITGITNAALMGQPTFKAIAPKVEMILKSSSFVVIHNAGFDAPFLAFEMDEAGFSLPSLEVIDTTTQCMWASYDSKPPKLEELCYACGVEYDRSKSHAARYDVEVMMACFFAGLDMGMINIPEFVP